VCWCLCSCCSPIEGNRTFIKEKEKGE
jgi:hypothetical protein